MVILACDQALSTSGWAIFKNNKLIAADSFTIPKNKTMDLRLMALQKELTELYHEYEFEKVYFEDIQLQAGNALTYKHLAYAQAAIILWCGNMNIDYEVLTPSHWRKVLGGNFGRKRADQKRHAIELVEQWTGLTVSSDVADAICIGKAGIQESNKGKVAFDASS